MSGLLEWCEFTPLKQKISLVILVLVLWGGMCYGLIVQPMMKEQEELVLKVQGLEITISKFSRFERQYLAAQEELSQWTSIANLQEASLGLEVPMSQVLSEMSNMSQKTLVNVTLWKPVESKVHSGTDLKEQRLRLHVEGGFHHVARFLDHMQDLSKAMGITAMLMHSADSTSGTPTIQTIIDFIGFKGAGRTLAGNSDIPRPAHAMEGKG
ncbi:hypothetical protein [Candidatus Nitronereus thalassa]|uniref:Pilus assembly protein, PilO n=1 Tax=Candidatus Nitronereus thalassa TaxID=3020898 RepID=A0ABU3KBD8_9BACT|nr:hypothetical protein [Candidatus Nitronereus thalassa]MDT7043820.1 hypothetical protein [Candidatus Nitronereus thalassa]